jgi:RNA methyltransferase, TrmH family
MIDVTSFQNTKIKHAKALRNRRQRDLSKEFLIEGYREIKRSVIGKSNIVTLFICPDFFLGENENKLIEDITAIGAEIYNCPKCIFEKISYRDRPDGLMAIAKQNYRNEEELNTILFTKDNPFIVVVEGVEKPGNLGTILRSCDGAGVDAVIVADPCTDVFNPNVVRASIGTLFTQKIFVMEGNRAIDLLINNNIKIVATTPDCSDVYYQTDMKGPVALAMGTEQVGLSSKWMDRAHIRAKIPMKGIADSLNVATATTIILYEVLRQRNG